MHKVLLEPSSTLTSAFFLFHRTTIDKSSKYTSIIATECAVSVVRSILESACIAIQAVSRRHASHHGHGPSRLLLRFHARCSADWTVGMPRQ
jgi:hypothetical protein